MHKNYKLKFSLFLVSFYLLNLNLFASEGTIKGKIIDENGEPLFAANIGIKGTSYGTSTDFDGLFELNVPEGKYDLSLSFIGFNTLEIKDVLVQKESIQSLNDIILTSNTVSLNTVTISATVQRNTESALMVVKKKSPILMDGISSQSFKKSADGNAASAAKRVSGVSVIGGKYVFIRGLGDRYTKTQLNSIDVPGLDPDRNSIQMDIFPTNILDNIKILKSFSADIPADFTGGIVDIETKSFPDEPFFSYSLGSNFNFNSSFNNNYLTYQGSKSDFLGFDGGLRSLPVSRTDQSLPVDIITNYDNMLEINNLFSKNLSVINKRSLIDGNFSFSFGNNKNIKDYKLGYFTSISYKNSFDYYDNKVENRWEKSSNPNIFNLEPTKKTYGRLGKNNISLSIMSALGLKTNKSSFKINLLHIQNGESKAGLFTTENYKSNVNIIKTDILDYGERSLSNFLFEGKHNFKDNKITYTWAISPTLSKIRDKDVREIPYEVIVNNNDTSYIIDPSNASRPSRTWRYLDEVNFVVSNKFKYKHSLFNKKANLISGLYYTFKERDFDVIVYTLNSSGIITNSQFSGNPDELLDNLAISNTNSTGFYHSGGSQISNKYNAWQTNIAPFISEDFYLNKSIRSIVGLRIEYFNQFYTGENQENEVLNNENVISDFGIYPSFNFIYELNKNQKIRTSYFRTTARPSFKEKSLAQIYDVISGTTFNGNINLVPTFINNFDLRYEIYGKKNNSATLSLFYKDLKNAIELTKFKSDEDNIQPVNSERSNIMGLEFELNSEIFFISDMINKYMLNFNSSFITSRTYLFGDELNSKLDNLRNGEVLSSNNDIRERFLEIFGVENYDYYRVMQGQAPYILNIGFNYQNVENKIQAGIFYNVQGKTLSVVSINREPDIYTSPFKSLNLNFTKKFGIEDRFKFNLGFKNILNSEKQMVTQSHESNEEIYSSFSPGRELYIKLSIDL